MKFLLGLAIVLGSTTAARGQSAAQSGQPYEAVVRVIAADPDGTSYGSGALVAVDGSHGLVITNWHVVRDATGQIVVVFPDGFTSGATVLRTDSDWDLAALAIWRPNSQPIPLSDNTPRPGDPLTIAGYGSGSFRTITGRCTQYVAPGNNMPFEMVELSAAARNGDSGGPILNSRGQLAGVLFGAAGGTTTGSYCGRVRMFLATVTDQFREVSPGETMIAQSVETPAAPRVGDDFQWRPDRAVDQAPLSAPHRRPAAPTAAISARHSTAPSPPQSTVAGWSEELPEPVAVASATTSPSHMAATPQSGNTTVTVGSTRLDQIKTYFAAIGAFAVFFHGLRFLVMVQDPKTDR